MTKRLSEAELRYVTDGNAHCRDCRRITKADLAAALLKSNRALKKIVKLMDPGNGVTYDMIATAMHGVASRSIV